MAIDLQQSFQKTVRALSMGDLASASRHAEDLLKSHPDHPEVQHIAAVVTYEAGNDEQGEALFARAMGQAPANPEIHFNLGSARLKSGQLERAVHAFDACLALNPGHDGALVNRGNVYRSLGDTDRAQEDYRAALERNPRHVGAMINLGNLSLGTVPETAFAWFEKALALQPSSPSALRGRGQARIELGRPEAGLSDLERAAQQLTTDPETHAALGRAYTVCLRLDKAVNAYARAAELEPENATAWNDLGTAHTGNGDLDAAENAFRNAIRLDPQLREPAENLAALLELANRDEEALELVHKTQAALGNSTALGLVEARCAVRRKEFDRSLALLELITDLTQPRMRKDYHFLSGRVLDGLERFDEAFEHYLAGNRISAEIWRDEGHAEDRFVAEVPDIARHARRIQSIAAPDMGPSPAFLMGFQRSGTTLIDTVLGTHEQVQVLEELPVLSRTIADMTHISGRYPQCLASLTADQVVRIRERYFFHARSLGWKDDGRLLLDKSPLHTVHAALLRVLFPQSPILFVLRHPLDVCLSCFMQDFTMNAFMTHFTTPEGVGRVYSAVMTSWIAVRERLEYPVHTVCYERLVADPSVQVRRIVEYLDLPWRESLLDHTRHARNRGLINTPSYEQVTRPINQSAVNRWQRYASRLEATRKAVQPFIEAFGYNENTGDPA